MAEIFQRCGMAPAHITVFLSQNPGAKNSIIRTCGFILNMGRGFILAETLVLAAIMATPAEPYSCSAKTGFSGRIKLPLGGDSSANTVHVTAHPPTRNSIVVLLL